jgi:hypothetical protein
MIETYISCIYLLCEIAKMKTSITNCAAPASSLTEANEVMDSFDLNRCSNLSMCEPNDFAHQRSPLPPPQKFPTRPNKPQEMNTNFIAHEGRKYFKKQSCRAIGAMISREENAHWPCTNAQHQIAAQTAASLLVGHELA